MERYTKAGDHVIAETFPDETVVVNLLTGLYYSLDGSAPAVWEDLLAGATVEETASRLHQQYEGQIDSIRQSVVDFVQQLQAESLLKTTTGASVPRPSTPLSARTPFVPPAVHRYSDLEQLLLLDPIHDVDASGWPVAATPTA